MTTQSSWVDPGFFLWLFPFVADPSPQDDIGSHLVPKEESASEFTSQTASHSDHGEIQSRKGNLGSKNAESER